MAGGGKRGGGDRVLESRHLVGLFLGVVLLCGVFFTLGYVMGRTQFSGSVHAADTPVRSAPPVPEAAPKKSREDAGSASPAANGEWDFDSKKENDRLEPSSNAPSEAAGKPGRDSAVDRPLPGKAAATYAKTPAKFKSPFIPKGAFVLQLAALKSENDALALADAAQQKRFPSFVVAPSGDALFRVQVGPYPDEKSAESAKQALVKAGFSPIIKR